MSKVSEMTRESWIMSTFQNGALGWWRTLKMKSSHQAAWPCGGLGALVFGSKLRPVQTSLLICGAATENEPTVTER